MEKKYILIDWEDRQIKLLTEQEIKEKLALLFEEEGFSMNFNEFFSVYDPEKGEDVPFDMRAVAKLHI